MQIQLHNLLSEFEQFGIPINRAWRAGLSDTEIDEIIGDRPIKLTQELRTYFRWHNGAADWIVGSYTPYSLQENLDLYHLLLNDIMEIPDQSYFSQKENRYVIKEWEYIWEPSWLPVFVGEKVSYFVPCHQENLLQTPLYYHDLTDPFMWIAYDSLTAFFQTTISAYKLGIYHLLPNGYILADDKRLARLLDQCNPRRREFLLESAASRSPEDLVENLANTDFKITLRAFYALIELFETDAVPLLIEKLHHPDTEVRQRVCDVLMNIAGIEVIPALEALANDPSQRIREMSQTVIRLIIERHERNLRVFGE